MNSYFYRERLSTLSRWITSLSTNKAKFLISDSIQLQLQPPFQRLG